MTATRAVLIGGITGLIGVTLTCVVWGVVDWVRVAREWA